MITTLRRVAPWLALTFVLGFIACEPVPPERVYLEDFETLCEGLPCGWERSGGTAPQLAYVSTIHPGIHGLRMDGTVTARGAGDPDAAALTFGSGALLSVTARCDVSSSLGVTVLLDDGGIVHTVEAPLLTLGRDFERAEVDLPVFGLTLSNAHVRTVILQKSGPGVCDVDEVLIHDGALCAAGCC